MSVCIHVGLVLLREEVIAKTEPWNTRNHFTVSINCYPGWDSEGKASFVHFWGTRWPWSVCGRVLCRFILVCLFLRLWQLHPSVGRGGGRPALTHRLSAQNKTLCPVPCEHAPQRKAEGLPAQPAGGGPLWRWGSLINHSRVLAAVRTAERRHVKASLTASNGEAVKNGAFDFIFEPQKPQAPPHFLRLKHLGHTRLQASKTV